MSAMSCVRPFSSAKPAIDPRALRGPLAAALLALSMSSAFALDPGEDGVRITIPVSGIADAAQAAIVDAQGNLVMAGSAGGNYSVLASITRTGALNGAFGTGGIYEHDLSPSLGDALRALVRMDDGRLAGCGTFFSAGTATDFVVARFMPTVRSTPRSTGSATR